MAAKTVPAKSKRKSTKAKSNSIQPSEPEITILKKASCPTLSQTGTIDYEISIDSNGAILIGLTGNSGAGYFSKARQQVSEIVTALEQFQAKHEITSLALKDLYTGSINSWSFLMAVLLSLGLVEPLKDNGRRFKLCNPETFLASLEKLKAQHTGSAEGKPNAKRKAATSMKTPRKKPATSK